MTTPSRVSLPSLPAQTPPPQLPPSAFSKRRRQHPDRRSMYNLVDRPSDPYIVTRDVIADESQVEEAQSQCQVFSNNAVFSCFPTNTTSIPQHQIASFVWNSNLPYFTQTNLVNIYLLDASDNQVLKTWLEQPNPSGRPGVLRTPVNDTWLGSRGSQWSGKNMTFLYYFVVTRNDVPLESGIPQPIFTAVQTTFADSVVASMSSTSAAAAASSRSASEASLSSQIAASLSSASAASASLTARPSSSGGSGDGSVQSGSQSAPFAHWAIAVIVVLGTLALIACGILVFFILRRVRNSRNSSLSHRGSMGSSAPMMANAQTGNAPLSPLLAGAALASAGAAGSHRPTSPDIHDGASTVSRGSESAPFSGADAAVIADAFRTTLRKFNFADRPVEEGESPEDPDEPEPQAGPPPHLGELMLNRQLAEEGRDIRSVSSSRGVKVETLSDHDTEPYQDRPH